MSINKISNHESDSTSSKDILKDLDLLIEDVGIDLNSNPEIEKENKKIHEHLDFLSNHLKVKTEYILQYRDVLLALLKDGRINTDQEIISIKKNLLLQISLNYNVDNMYTETRIAPGKPTQRNVDKRNAPLRPKIDGTWNVGNPKDDTERAIIDFVESRRIIIPGFELINRDAYTIIDAATGKTAKELGKKFELEEVNRRTQLKLDKQRNKNRILSIQKSFIGAAHEIQSQIEKMGTISIERGKQRGNITITFGPSDELSGVVLVGSYGLNHKVKFTALDTSENIMYFLTDDKGDLIYVPTSSYNLVGTVESLIRTANFINSVKFDTKKLKAGSDTPFEVSGNGIEFDKGFSLLDTTLIKDVGSLGLSSTDLLMIVDHLNTRWYHK